MAAEGSMGEGADASSATFLLGPDPVMSGRKPEDNFEVRSAIIDVRFEASALGETEPPILEPVVQNDFRFCTALIADFDSIALVSVL
jgi:hypothetical protein